MTSPRSGINAAFLVAPVALAAVAKVVLIDTSSPCGSTITESRSMIVDDT